MDLFVLCRLQGAIKAQIRSYPLAPPHFTPLSLVIGAAESGQLISKLYHTCLYHLLTHVSKVWRAWEAVPGSRRREAIAVRPCE
mgnify:CR=1 FL=1